MKKHTESGFPGCRLIVLSALFMGTAWATDVQHGMVNGEGELGLAERGVVSDPIAGIVVEGDSYFAYTDESSTCNDDGTFDVNSSAAYAQMEGTIQTSERNPALATGEQIIRGPAGESSGDGQWNGFQDWPLEPDGTAFETIRGRDGDALDSNLIYEVTVHYDCNGVNAGDPPALQFEAFHRGQGAGSSHSVPALSSRGLLLFGLLILAVAVLRLRSS